MRSVIRRILVYVCIILLTMIILIKAGTGEKSASLKSIFDQFLHPSEISSEEGINLRSDDGTCYYFTYKDEDFYCEYAGDTWTIYNSYKIKNPTDIYKICKALDQEHRVPSRDYSSYRTPADMAFEWEQHNIAYDQLPEGNYWRESARNVDLDPEDQGKSFKEIYEERTGNTLDLDKIVENKDKITDKVKEKLKEKIKEILVSS